MNDIIIKFEGNDVIIRGPKEILKIVVDPVFVGAKEIIGPAEPATIKKYKGKKSKKPAKVVSKPKERKAKTKITPDIINQINYLRDDENMTSKQIAEELNIGLSTVNRYYRPLPNEKI